MISRICIFGVSYVRDEVSPYGPIFFKISNINYYKFHISEITSHEYAAY
jgi:hypothetical protein